MSKQQESLVIPSAKVILLGNSSVGKTSIILQFYKSIFDEENQPTIGAAYVSKTLSTAKGLIELHVWDTAGQERFKSIIPMYMRGCAAVVFVCSADNENSIDDLSKWKDLLDKNQQECKNIFVVLNKIDYRTPEPITLAREWAEKYEYHYAETSAKENRGIAELFNDIGERIIQNSNFQSIQDSVLSSEETPKKGTNCC